MATMQQKRSRPYPIERRPPQLLKDLLRQDSCCNISSCSSSGFKSLPRFPSSSTNHQNKIITTSDSNLRLQPQPPPPPPPQEQPTPSFKRSRSRSRAAAEATVSLLHKLLNAVIKPPNLPSRISRKSEKNTDGVVNRVRVKDILRWKSFRDLIGGQDERPLKQLEACTLDTDAESVSGNNTSSVSSSRLAAEEQVEEKGDEELTRLLGECGSSSGNLAAGTEDALLLDGVEVGPRIPKSREEDDHGTPVSVLDSPFNYRDEEEDHEYYYYDEENQESSLTSLDQTLTNIERTKQRLLENLKWFESLAAGVDQQQTDDSDEQDDLEITEELESSSSIDDDGEKADEVLMETQCDDSLPLYDISNNSINDQDSIIFSQPDGYHNNTSDSNRLIIHGGMNNIKGKIDRNCARGAILRQCGMLKGSYNQLSKECMEWELGEHGNKVIIDEEGDRLGVDIEIVLLNELLDEFLFQHVVLG